ncbi:MAG TPA: hypothetical protein VFF55_08070 [Candidatus Deferrimicrobium sp.]|nr:hypothetical protein [Candidatus Deferrimicrobium sp.]
METSRAPLGAAEQVLDRELELVRSAISMVASGGASRVRLGGLCFGEQLLDQAGSLGRAAGVRVTPVWTASDGGGVGFSVEEVRGAGH